MFNLTYYVDKFYNGKYVVFTFTQILQTYLGAIRLLLSLSLTYLLYLYTLTRHLCT